VLKGLRFTARRAKQRCSRVLRHTITPNTCLKDDASCRHGADYLDELRDAAELRANSFSQRQRLATIVSLLRAAPTCSYLAAICAMR
jgi:hypothetical protein